MLLWTENHWFEEKKKFIFTYFTFTNMFMVKVNFKWTYFFTKHEQ